MSKKQRFSMVRSCALIGLSILLLLAVSTAQGYTYTNLGDAGGWDDVEKSAPPVTYVLDRSDYTSDSGLNESQITGALTNAFDSWAAVKGSSLTFAEQTDRGGNYDLFDGLGGSLDQGADYLYANITFGGWLDNSYFDYLDNGVFDGGVSSILAVTWTGKVRGPASRKPRWVSDIYFNDGWDWSTSGGGIDIETVMVHELGHGIGLGHEDDVPAIMNSWYTESDRDLYDDDIAGVSSLYPSSGGDGGGGGGGGKPPWAGGGGGKSKGLSFVLVQDYDAFSTASVPEPTTLLLLVPSLAILLGRFRKRS